MSLRNTVKFTDMTLRQVPEILDAIDMIDGNQAEYARAPYADNSLYLLPENLSEDTGVMLSDALPTGHEIGVLNGNQTR